VAFSVAFWAMDRWMWTNDMASTGLAEVALGHGSLVREHYDDNSTASLRGTCGASSGCNRWVMDPFLVVCALAGLYLFVRGLVEL